MKFTEHEMTTALTGLAKHYLAQIHPDKDADDFGVDAAWENIPRFNRYKTLEVYGDLVLPVLVALPDVDVEPGTRPVFDDNQVLTAAQQVVADREAAGRSHAPDVSADDAVKSSFLTTRLALRFLPVRLDADGLLTGDDIESAAADFTVPDTLEGL